MRNLLKSVAMSVLGAAAMYYLDPDRGRRRRVLMRDRLDWASQEASDFVQDQTRRARMQVKELAASARRPFSHASSALGQGSPGERLGDRIDPWMSRPAAWDRTSVSIAGGSRGGLMDSIFKGVALCAVTAAAMYYLDPEMGRRRRGLVRDKFDSMSHGARDYARSRSKMAADHVKGWAASARAPFEGRLQTRRDRQLCERIRAELGRALSHPKAVDVEVSQGKVCLRGQVLASELQTLLSTVQGMSGVQHVDNRLEVHEAPSDIALLQGGEHPAPSDRTAPRTSGGASVWH